MLCWCSHVLHCWTRIWCWWCYLPIVVQAQPSSLLYTIYRGQPCILWFLMLVLWLLSNHNVYILKQIDQFAVYVTSSFPYLLKCVLVSFLKLHCSFLINALKLGQICIMLCADHGPCVSGAHNTIVTARAGKDLVSSLVSGNLKILSLLWPLQLSVHFHNLSKIEY